MSEPDQMLTTTADVELTASDGDRPATIKIVAYRGGVMVASGVGKTIVDLDGVDLGEHVVLLADHSNEIDSIVGSGTPSIYDNAILVEGTIAKSSEAGEQILSLHRDGVRFEASIGLRMDETSQMRPGDTTKINGRFFTADRPTMIVKRGRLREISLVPNGADSSSQVNIAAKQGTNKMPNETQTEVTIDDEIRAQERERFVAIEQATSGDWSHDAVRVSNIKARAVSGEITVTELQAGMLRIIRTGVESQPLPANSIGGGGGLTQNSLECALLLKAGHSDIAESSFDERTLQAAQGMAKLSQVDLARMSLQANGIDTPSDRADIVNASLQTARPGMMTAAAGLSTMSLPVALGNAANKTLLAHYQENSNSWRSFAAKKSAPDFKISQSLRPSLVESLDEVGADGELKHGSLDESVFDYQLSTFGKIVSFSRQAMINDDLGLLQETVPLLGKAAARKVADEMYRLVLNNPGNYFSASNSNLLEATPLDTAGLGNAVRAMRNKVDGSGNPIDLMPKTLLVPPSLEQTARGLLNSELIEAQTDQPTGNTLRNVADLVVEPRLENANFSGNSQTSWYLFSRVEDSAFVAAFLDGIDAPRIEYFGLETEASILAVRWRVYLDFGVAVGDPMAGVKCEA